MNFVKKSQAKRLFPKRPTWSKKGDFGRLLVISGSRTYTGSPLLAALSAVKAGTDWVDVFSPERAADIAASFSPDLITHPQKADFLNPWHINEALKIARRDDAVTIGNGITRNKGTEKFVLGFLKKTQKPCVIDADAIHIIAKNKNAIKNNFILTPHSKEFFVLTGTEPSINLKERTETAKRFAQELGCVILLKGGHDIITDGERVLINKTGNPFMTKAGTGDTLAGICGSLLARGATPFDAACAGAYINGLAGDIAARKFGEGLTATDLINEIPSAIKTL